MAQADPMGCTQSPSVHPALGQRPLTATAAGRRVSIAETGVSLRDLGVAEWVSRLAPSPARDAEQDDGAAAPEVEVACQKPLPAGCAMLVAKLDDCAQAHRVDLEELCESRSGAVVLLMTPQRADGRKLPVSVVKFDRGVLRVSKGRAPCTKYSRRGSKGCA